MMKARKSKKKDIILGLFRPDEAGESRWVTVDEIKAAGLSWSTNGNVRRGVAFGFSDVKWDFRRKGGQRSEVLALRMCGWNTADSNHRSINPSIREHFAADELCNFSRLPIPNANDREIDHRYGHKDHPDYVRIYNHDSQRAEDFQLIHRSLNLIKREICGRCVAEGIRPAHPELGYAEGGSSLQGNLPCKGCYLAEPERFRKSAG